MRALEALVAATWGGTKVRLAGELPATPMWSTQIRGSTAHHVVVEPGTSSIYVSDGWGVSYAGLRFSRLDLLTGAAVAAVRTGTAVRCLARLADGDLIAATDSKLFQLDPLTLEERRRWDRRVPSVADSIVVDGDQVALANWLRAGVAIFDLTTGRVRRRPTSAMVSVHAAGKRALIVGGSTGGIESLDLATGAIEHLSDAPPIVDADVAGGDNRVVAVVGERAYATETAVGPGAASRQVLLLPLDRSGPGMRITLPRGAREVAAGHTATWFTPGPVSESDQFVLSVSDLGGPEPIAQMWRATRGELIVAVHPDAGLVATVRNEWKANSAQLTCYRLAAGAR